MSPWAKTPKFWWRRERISPLATLLAPIGAVYGHSTRRRMMRSAHLVAADLPVICVGNFVAGGAGKTPFCIELARLLAEGGHAPVFLTRGYDGREHGPVRVDERRHSAFDVGDEALLLNSHFPVIVARDRKAGAQLAAAYGDTVIMDDGLQNGSIAKDYVFALVDEQTGFGNMRCIPAGPLRALPHTQMLHVDHLAVIGEGRGADDAIRLAARRGVPVARARLCPTNAEMFVGLRLLAYSGIGRPEKFFATLRNTGAEIAATRAFPDHHMFTPRQARRLIANAFMLDARLAATEKDLARLANSNNPDLRLLARKTLPLKINMKIDSGAELMRHIMGRIGRRRSRSAEPAAYRPYDGEMQI